VAYTFTLGGGTSGTATITGNVYAGGRITVAVGAIWTSGNIECISLYNSGTFIASNTIVNGTYTDNGSSHFNGNLTTQGISIGDTASPAIEGDLINLSNDNITIGGGTGGSLTVSGSLRQSGAGSIELRANAGIVCQSLYTRGLLINNDGVYIATRGDCIIASTFILGGGVSGSITVAGHFSCAGGYALAAGASLTYVTGECGGTIACAGSITGTTVLTGGNTHTIDFLGSGGLGAITKIITNDNVAVANMTGSDVINSITVQDAATLVIENTCTSGLIGLYGVGHLTNNSLVSVTGSMTGTTNPVVMTDAAANFAAGALVGLTIYNTTDSSSGIITANTATTVTVAYLTGGTHNVWFTGDAYTVTLTGTVTDPVPNLLVMTDALANFEPGALVGLTIHDTSDPDSQGIITANDATTITCGGGLSGGTNNIWNFGDTYTVTISDTHTGVNTPIVMTDAVATFAVDSLIGLTITNTTDVSHAVITDNDANTITVAYLIGGTKNIWTTADAYSVAYALVVNDHRLSNHW
jgi:cytoskeletal protein CcmA (bactofilin family)